MIVKTVTETSVEGSKIKEVTIRHNNIIYTITTDFLGIKITNDHYMGLTIFPTDSKNTLIIK